MTMEGGETVKDIRKNEGEQENVPGDTAAAAENQDQQHRETGEPRPAKPDGGADEAHPSPRGVLEIPSSGSDSDRSSVLSSIDSGSFENEKHAADEGSAWDLSYGTVHFKKLFGQIKRRSMMRFSTIPFLGGYGYDLSKKAFRRRLGRNHSSEDAIDCGDFVVPKPSWRNFSYSELKQATDNFSSERLIGKGGSAEVYKGILPDGQVVAVKKIIKEQKNDEDRVGDFLSELGIIAHIDHPNTAKLIGFSADGGLHLVLQFSPHGSLTTALFVSEGGIEWKIRYRVAVGVAEGLKYLHIDCQRRIVHRDITASNILLSENFDAQISDFGLAKWLPDKWLHHVVSPIEGTFGYMAPEYFMHGIVHEKTDVFAFGVLLLELITGRRAVDPSRQSLVMWAKPLLQQNNVKEIADPRLGDDYNLTEIKRAMFTASVCVHHLPNMRPTMNRVVQLLKGEHEALDMKQKSMGVRTLLWDACDLDDYNTTAYQKDLSRHLELVME